MRAVFEMLGISDVVAKSIGSQNPYNMIRATMNGLGKQSSPRQVASRRGKKVADILPARDNAPAPEAEETTEIRGSAGYEMRPKSSKLRDLAGCRAWAWLAK